MRKPPATGKPIPLWHMTADHDEGNQTQQQTGQHHHVPEEDIERCQAGLRDGATDDIVAPDQGEQRKSQTTDRLQQSGIQFGGGIDVVQNHRREGSHLQHTRWRAQNLVKSAEINVYVVISALA